MITKTSSRDLERFYHEPQRQRATMREKYILKDGQ